MRNWFAVGIVLSGTSLAACGDEKAGPGVGPDTSWQVFVKAGESGVGQDAHGPLSGTKEDDPADDQDIKVKTCRHDAAGIQLELEDEGVPSSDTDRRPRARSVLAITNVDLDKERCTVTLTEYDSSGSPLKFVDRCDGNSTPGSCNIDLEENSDDYALNGTLSCDGMALGSAGMAIYTLRKAREKDEPMQLQIAHCK